MEIEKLCDDFQELRKDTHLTIEFQSDLKARPSTVIMGKKFEWHTPAMFRPAYLACERGMVYS
jgi:hypothetical protein